MNRTNRHTDRVLVSWLEGKPLNPVVQQRPRSIRMFPYAEALHRGDSYAGNSLRGDVHNHHALLGPEQVTAGSNASEGQYPQGARKRGAGRGAEQLSHNRVITVWGVARPASMQHSAVGVESRSPHCGGSRSA